jgi:hypothetical protein
MYMYEDFSSLSKSDHLGSHQQAALNTLSL